MFTGHTEILRNQGLLILSRYLSLYLMCVKRVCVLKMLCGLEIVLKRVCVVWSVNDIDLLIIFEMDPPTNYQFSFWNSLVDHKSIALLRDILSRHKE